MSENKKSTLKIVTVIGLLSIAIGLYNLLNGEVFSTYFFPLFIGVSLAGTAYFSKEKFNKEK